MQRCAWGSPWTEPLLSYHDSEWGVQQHDDRVLFEFLVLEGMQAGLSWMTILNKRMAFREAFDGFDPTVVATYDDRKVRELLSNEGIVRNRLKIASAIVNAKAFLTVQADHGSFDAYFWSFVGSRPKVNSWRSLEDIPPKTLESEAVSKDLKSKGFKFVGPNICYALMQSVGLVIDHTVDCFRYAELAAQARV
jgi:DNA-3-methyladenine glycosylase I